MQGWISVSSYCKAVPNFVRFWKKTVLSYLQWSLIYILLHNLNTHRKGRGLLFLIVPVPVRQYINLVP